MFMPRPKKSQTHLSNYLDLATWQTRDGNIVWPHLPQRGSCLMVVRLLWQAIVTRTSRFGNAHIHPTTYLSCSLLPKLRSAGAREVLKPFCLLCLCCPFPASPDWEILTSVQPLLSGLLQIILYFVCG